MKDFIKYNWPSILWAAFVLVICLLPPSNLPKSAIPHLDKLVHFGSYFLLAALLYFGWNKQTSLLSLQQNSFLKILLLCAVYGLSIEILQTYVDRSFDWWDELTNIGGAIAGNTIMVYVTYKKRLK